ncbi:glycosyl hydrolase [Segetibacter sp. 3557_3]|uniref:glycoside hydrolase family 2 protein n=1 Tax=Segetibacter sp. 3557_3 TaxID=2547429 RepID=UPI0010584141|nr:glycoside hydrolase family 2 TIM barrel-domain containing protein [Segetibacter sp. 3557_3]TDH28616.1 glycosyl hydrolase [Segetibacter sp. 3557_3]
MKEAAYKLALVYKPICSLIALLLVAGCCIQASAQTRYELKMGWVCAPVTTIKADGNLLSNPALPLTGMKPAVVPGTVLTTLLQNKQVPDPFYGMNNEQIPDIYTTGRDHYTYWFVKDFRETLPADGQQVWLQFRGVNYGCDIYLNGSRLNDTTFKGMYLRQQYNISKLLRKDGKNRLAVIVYPPDPVGNPNGGQGGDGTIAKNVTLQYVAGWDWIQPIRDRNTGIWDKVFIEKTGSINIQNPHVVTVVPGTRKPGGLQQPAMIHVSAELLNAGDKTISGKLRYTIAGVSISQRVSLPANTNTLVRLPEMIMRNPKLWWPAGYGAQNLYVSKLEFIEDGKVADMETISVGIRQIRREWNGTTLSSQFSVNGQKIFIKGGNWIISDAMLRLSAKRYDAEVRLHRDMNLNLIRIWGGALLERPEFYAACDKYGMLVFQDFWMSGDCNGRWNDPRKLESRQVRRQYPDDHGLFIRSAADGIKLIRNHASLAIWCGGNEITPPDDILKVMKDSLFPALDGTRYFFDYSNSDSMSKNILNGGGDGPYTIQPTDTFWKFRTYPFNSEVGSVGLGDYESLERFIPKENMIVPEYVPAVSSEIKAVEKVDPVWEYHRYIGYENYISPYGKPSGVRDFALKGQLVNYNQYRSLMEGFSARMWDWYTGTIIWKTQNPWTALRGQMYDYYLDPNACLYGLRSGSEPVHVMYNPLNGAPMVVNNSFESLKLQLLITAVDMDGRSTVLRQDNIEIGASAVKDFEPIKREVDELKKNDGTFLSIRLMNNKELVSDNFYWLPNEQQQYLGLQHIGQAAASITARRVGQGKVQVTITNPANGTVAFFNRLSLVNAQTKKRLMPVYYSDNYVSVLPGEQKKVLLEYEANGKPLVSLQGWNVKEQFVSIQ